MFAAAHGGVGSKRELDEYVQAALDGGLERGETALDIAIEAVIGLENDEHFNAGKGSRMRMDGSIQMDAAVMTEGEIGAVGAIEKVKNPVLVAREIYRSPFVMLVGTDATQFARDVGYEEYDPVTEHRLEELEEMREKLNAEGRKDKLQKLREFYEKVDGGDTVGCVAYKDGEFAAAVSTGGTSYCWRGRVGDSPMVGSGFFVGENGAVVATGKGEAIIKRMASYKCHEYMGEYGVDKACKKVVETFPDEVSIGLIAVTDDGCGICSNKQMSQAVFED
ncbi:MAG: isoaspartyl peptidase/L-asparaginase [Thermoplasmatota archaeon]